MSATSVKFTGVNFHAMTGLDVLIRNQMIYSLIKDVHDYDYVALDDRFVRDFAKHGGRSWKAPYHHGAAREWVKRDVTFNERATLAKGY